VKLELLVATLIDLDAMDGKRSVSLIAECSSSPDVNTRYTNAFVMNSTCIHLRVKGPNIYMYRRGRIYKEPPGEIQ
jgi:hypothetical protein